MERDGGVWALFQIPAALSQISAPKPLVLMRRVFWVVFINPKNFKKIFISNFKVKKWAFLDQNFFLVLEKIPEAPKKRGMSRLFSGKGWDHFGGRTLFFWERFLGNTRSARIAVPKNLFLIFLNFFYRFWTAMKGVFALKARKRDFYILHAQKPCLTEVFVHKRHVFLKISVVRGSNIWMVLGVFGRIRGPKKREGIVILNLIMGYCAQPRGKPRLGA